MSATALWIAISVVAMGLVLDLLRNWLRHRAAGSDAVRAFFGRSKMALVVPGVILFAVLFIILPRVGAPYWQLALSEQVVVSMLLLWGAAAAVWYALRPGPGKSRVSRLTSGVFGLVFMASGLLHLSLFGLDVVMRHPVYAGQISRKWTQYEGRWLGTHYYVIVNTPQMDVGSRLYEVLSEGGKVWIDANDEWVPITRKWTQSDGWSGTHYYIAVDSPKVDVGPAMYNLLHAGEMARIEATWASHWLVGVQPAAALPAAPPAEPTPQ